MVIGLLLLLGTMGVLLGIDGMSGFDEVVEFVVGFTFLTGGIILLIIGFWLLYPYDGYVCDLQSNAIIYVDEDNETWVYETNKYIVEQYQIGDKVSFERIDITSYEDYID